MQLTTASSRIRNDPFTENSNFRTDTALEKSKNLWSFKYYLFTFAKDIRTRSYDDSFRMVVALLKDSKFVSAAAV